MIAEILLVSSEKNADTMRTNAQYIARCLGETGHEVRGQICLCQDTLQLQQAIARALARSHILITLGGLSSQMQYMTKTTIAQGLGLPMETSPLVVNAIAEYCKQTGEPLSPEEDRALAQMPKGSTVFPGTYGKIPGFAISSGKQHIIVLPETPSEIIPMLNSYVQPYLTRQFSAAATKTVRTYGITEKEIRQKLADLLAVSNPKIVIHPQKNEAAIEICAQADTSQQAATLCASVLRTVLDRLGDAAYGLDVPSLPAALAAKCSRKRLDIAVAELGTQGGFAALLRKTDEGASVLREALAADTWKPLQQQLKTLPKRRKKQECISEWTAVQMASAIRETTGSKIGIAIAACTNQHATKQSPPGLVYIAVCSATHIYIKKLVIGHGDADDAVIVEAAVSRALNMARLFVDYLPDAYPGAISLHAALAGTSVTEDADSISEPKSEFKSKNAPKKPRSMVKRVICTFATVTFLLCSGYLAMIAYQSYQVSRVQDALNNMFGDASIDEIPEDYPRKFKNLKFAALWTENPDVRGFIHIPDTSLNYPIVQKYDNQYYLRRDFYGHSNQYGIPFFDFRVNVEKPSDNMVVYGHNMTDGKMFGELLNYKNLSYYKAHPIIELNTVFEDRPIQYKIFSVFITNGSEKQGELFDYFNFIDAKNHAQFKQFIEQLTYRSLIKTSVDVVPGDELITLSTCSYELKDMRTVVVARKLRRGESTTDQIQSAVLHTEPLYPNAWYQKYGGSKPAGINDTWTVGTTASKGIGYRDYTKQPSVMQASQAPSVAPVPLPTAPSPQQDVSTPQAPAPNQQTTNAEEQRRQVAEGEEQRRQAAEEEEQRRQAAEEEEQRRQAAEEEEQRKQAAEEEEQRKQAAEEEEQRRQTAEEEEQRRQAAEEEEQRKQAAEEEEQRRQAAEAAEQSRQELAAQQASLDTPLHPENIAPMSMPVSANLTVNVNGTPLSTDAYSIVSGIVENEVGPSFHPEAIKAQAVATYSYILHQNSTGITPSVHMDSSVSDKVQSAVSSVIGQTVQYNNQVAFTPYHATSAGMTTSSAAVWGGNYPYLVPVDSSVDKVTPYYSVETALSRASVEERLSSRLHLQPSGDPSGWFQILNYAEGNYVGDMAVCGQTTSDGKKITGRLMRENVLNLRSACFDVRYDAGTDTFIFTTYGYGHGVGLSQNGANAYASQGWNYQKILQHYFPGTAVQ